jgi:hypothetical protein
VIQLVEQLDEGALKRILLIPSRQLMKERPIEVGDGKLREAERPEKYPVLGRLILGDR